MDNQKTFQHSVKVPRLFKMAARIVKEAAENRVNVKELVYKTKHTNIKGLYALAVETIRRNDELDYLIRKSKILEKESRLDEWLCKILITELLWGKQRLLGDAKPVKTVLSYKQILKAHCSDFGNEEEERKVTVLKPKYVRVNTLKTTVDEIINLFRDDGWIFVRHFEDKNYESFLSRVASLTPEEFMLDLHVKELLVFPPKSEFHFYPFYQDGRVVIQDKASCLPAVLLNPQPGSIVMDMCAAPGMKTTQMAAAMKNEGTIYAVEFNMNRFESLNKVVETAGATCVKTINRDVISLTSRDFEDVEYILIDPSCSGSGMVDRNDFNTNKETKTNLERLEKLAGFQIKILKTALHRFPKAKRIVYSTCSLYTQENEEVIKEVLASSLKYKLVPADKYLSAPWSNFGSSKFGDIGKYCLYARPEKDYTNGFFVAVLERLEDGEENPFVVIDLERKPRKRKGVDDDDVEFVSVTKLGKGDKKKNKKLKGNNENHVAKVNNKANDMLNKRSEDDVIEISYDENQQTDVEKHRKRKNKSNGENVESDDVVFVEENLQNVKKHKKKKNKSSVESLDSSDVIFVDENPQNADKKLKTKKQSKDTTESLDPSNESNKRGGDEMSCEKMEKPKTKKHKHNGDSLGSSDVTEENNHNDVKKLKKKKNKDKVADKIDSSIVISVETNKNSATDVAEVFCENTDDGVKKPKKKKNKHITDSLESSGNLDKEENSQNGVKKHKKKKNNGNVESLESTYLEKNVVNNEENSQNSVKKHKKKKNNGNIESLESTCLEENVVNKELSGSNIDLSNKSNKNGAGDVTEVSGEESLQNGVKRQKKKKNASVTENVELVNITFIEDNENSNVKKHKKMR